MDSQWRSFALVFALAAAVATPVFGQAVAPTTGPGGSEEQSAASFPDLSGIWVHSIPGFEPLGIRSHCTGQPVASRERHWRHPQA
jgi:hypothetical protein